MNTREFDPVHPGEILLEEFLKPMGITPYRLAEDIGVSQHWIDDIIHGKRGITADIALRLGRFFGMEAQFWGNLQARYDLLCAQAATGSRLDQEVRALAA